MPRLTTSDNILSLPSGRFGGAGRYERESAISSPSPALILPPLLLTHSLRMHPPILAVFTATSTTQQPISTTHKHHAALNTLPSRRATRRLAYESFSPRVGRLSRPVPICRRWPASPNGIGVFPDSQQFLGAESLMHLLSMQEVVRWKSRLLTADCGTDPRVALYGIFWR